MKTTLLSNFKYQLIFLLLCPAGICFFSGCSDPLEELANENTDAIVTKTVIWICSDSYIGTYVDGVLVYGYNGTHCWPELQGGYPEYPWAGGSDPYIPDEPPSSQGGGSGTATSWSSQFIQLQGIYGYNSTLNLSEKDRLHAALYAMNNTGPVQYRDLLVKLKERINLLGRRLTFKMEPGAYEGQYILQTKTIIFENLDAINFAVLGEELIHATQDFLFYGASMDDDYKNYDFEAKVFYDLAFHMLDSAHYRYMGLDQAGFNEEYRREYREWIDSLAIGVRYFPAVEIRTFNYLIQKWPVPGDTIPNFSPQLLRYFFGHPIPITP